MIVSFYLLPNLFQSLHYAHVRLHYYARKMDHLCMSLVNRCGKCSFKCQKILSSKPIWFIIFCVHFGDILKVSELSDAHLVEKLPISHEHVNVSITYLPDLCYSECIVINTDITSTKRMVSLLFCKFSH